MKIVHIAETDSTNRWLRQNGGEEDMVVVADYQTAGRGCGTNTWESERGKNLLFSVLLHPAGMKAAKQFSISMAMSLSICQALDQRIGDVCIKWPNDIYWRNGKLGGILIEHRLQGDMLRETIIGVGLNVNQEKFLSNAPNPVSLWQIHGQPTDREQLLDDILQALPAYMEQDLRTQYAARLYRNRGFHPYTDKDGAFMAELVGVEDDGHLVLHDDDGRERRYAFKEVSFVV